MNFGRAVGISVFALVFQHAPLPTSPVDGGGVTAPSPPAGRVGVGAMFKSLRKGTYQTHASSQEIIPHERAHASQLRDEVGNCVGRGGVKPDDIEHARVVRVGNREARRRHADHHELGRDARPLAVLP